MSGPGNPLLVAGPGNERGEAEIRAIAIAGVLLYHSDIFWFPGGLLGVEVFFVVSGFLITSLLLAELAQ